MATALVENTSNANNTKRLLAVEGTGRQRDQAVMPKRLVIANPFRTISETGTRSITIGSRIADNTTTASRHVVINGT